MPSTESYWGGTSSPGDYQRLRALRAGISDDDLDDFFTSYEYFAGLPRVLPGIKDSEAAEKRVGYRGTDRRPTWGAKATPASTPFPQSAA